MYYLLEQADKANNIYKVISVTNSLPVNTNNLKYLQIDSNEQEVKILYNLYTNGTCYIEFCVHENDNAFKVLDYVLDNKTSIINDFDKKFSKVITSLNHLRLFRYNQLLIHFLSKGIVIDTISEVITDLPNLDENDIELYNELQQLKEEVQRYTYNLDKYNEIRKKLKSAPTIEEARNILASEFIS